MANILENIKEHGLVGGLVEAARDSFGKGEYQGSAHFYVVDENGDKTEVSNESATPIYKTPTGFSNTRSYAYLTQGDNGKLTLNYSSDLANSDAFRKNYLDNDTFKEVVRSYNANTNADTVIQTKNADGTVENVKFSDLINNYNTALNEFASNYEGFSLVRDNFKNNTGFDLSDEEIRIATNTIGDDDKKSETKAIFLPQEWLSIYDFSKLPSFDAETKTVSAKDFFEAYDLDKDGGINEEAWNEMIGSANGIVANAYSGNMKKNVDEDAEGDEEAIATAKDRLVRAYSASNLLASHDPEQSFLHTVGIVSSNAVLTLGNNVSQVVGKFATLGGAVIDSVTYFGELGIASIKDKSIQMATLQGAVAEDFQSGSVTPNNFNEYIDGILVSSTDGSMSEVEKVKAEWQAKIKGKQTLADLSYAEGTTFRDMQDAVDWQIAYTAKIAPVAAQAGAIMGEFAFLALEVAVANGLGSSTGALVSSEAGTVKALSTAFKSTSTLTRLKALANFAVRNKAVSFSANMLTQAMVDTFVFEDTDTFLNAWARLDPGAQKELSRAFADNLVGNSVAEVIGIGSSAIGGKLAASNNKGILWIRSRAAKAAAWASLPKKKAQAAFAGTKMAQLLSKPIGKGTRQASDMFIKAVNDGTGTVFKSKTLEEYNVEKFQMEYAATKNIANAKAGDVIVTDFEKNTTKISETTTEAILGKVAEKTNFLNQAARIAEGVKATTDSIIADETVGAAYKGVTDGAVELQKTLKWKDFNPAMGKYLSQDASNYVANKVHFEDLMRKKSILDAEKKVLSPLEQKKLEDLSNWLKEFATTHSDDAIDALNLFIEKQQALNKALTDWQVRNGIMTKATYDSLSGTGYYGANDELYVKTVAIPDGKTMEELDEKVNASIYVETQRDFLDGAGVRGANYVYKQDMHLSNSIDSNYLDPVLVNSLTINNIAKAYQGRMWYNSMVAIKAPTREIDVTGKPVKKREIENVMKHARNSAEEAIDSVSLKELGEGTLGKTFQESSTTEVRGKGKDRVEINKVDKYQEKVNKKLGIANDKQIATNVGILDEAQTKTVLATFGDEAPAYGKCKTNKELKATFEGLSEKQQEQALKAMGKNPVETKKTITTQKKNPEYAAWKKEKAAFEKEQAKAKAAFDKEQAKLAKQNTKKTSTKFPKEAKKQLEKDMRDAILYDSNTDIKSWKELSTDEVNAKLTDARKKEIGDILKDDFDIDKFRELDNHKIEDAIKPEYIEQVRAKYGGDVDEPNQVTGAVDLHDYRSEVETDPLSGEAVRRGYYNFVKDHTTSTLKENDVSDKIAWIATEQIVSPATRATNNLNAAIRNSGINLGLDGAAPDIAIKDVIDSNIDVSSIVGNYYGREIDPLTGEIELGSDDYINLAKELGAKNVNSLSDAEKVIKSKAEEGILDMLKNGNAKLTDDTVMYRVVSTEGNKVNKGDLSWLSKESGDFSDDGFMFVTFDESKVLDNKNLRGGGDRYALRIHAPKGTKLFTQQGSHYLVADGVLPIRLSYSGAGSGGELILTPGQKGKFVKSGEKIGDAEYVDVYLDGWNRPIRPATKTFDKLAPDEFLTETSTKVESSKVKAIDEPGALRAWNQAVANTSMVDDLNKTFIAERVNPAEGGPKKMTEATKKTLTDAIAEKTKYNFSPESVSVEGKTMDDLVEEYTKKGNKENAYNEAVKKLEDAKAMEKAVAEGTDPFSLSTMEFGESVIEIGAYRLKNSAVGADLAKKASEYGIEDDSIFEYYVLSSMVENAPDGTIRLSKKFKRAFEDKYEARFLKAPNSEGQMDQLGLKKLMSNAEEKIERLVLGRWASYQNDLVERGATDLIDTNKYFDAIEGEMKKIAGDISGNRNIIQVLDTSGEYKYVEVDPIVADLYRSRPYNNRDNDSFIRKLSRLSRLGKTSLNPVSVMNQNFKDAIQSFVMAGWAHSVTTYSKEIAEMFGDQFVNYLRESMGEDGWLKFSEGLTDSETRLKATELMTTGKMGAEPFAGSLTSRQLFRKNAPQEDLAGQIRNEAAEAYSYLGGYTKKKGLSAKKNAKKGLIDAIEDISPGGAINNWRETYFRKANYTSAMNDALKRGETLSQARATAEFVSRNATTNFRNTFMWGNILCDNVPFLSAAINGSASFWRLFEMDPVGVLTRINASGMAVIAQVISSGQSLEDRNTLKNVPDWVKRSGAVFIVNGSVYTIPLPEEIAVFLAPFRQTAEKMLGSEDRSWIELLYNDALEISPINLDGFSTDDQSKLTKNQGLLSRLGRQVQVLLSQVSPPIVKTAIMAATGIDPYTGNEIDNSYVWYDEDGNRQIMDYTTSETARGLSNISKQFNWNISPSMAQSLFEEALGTGFLQMSDDVVNLYEAFFSGKNVDGKNIDRTKTAFSPITSAVENAASAVVVEDYQIKDKYDKDFKALITSLERKKNELLTPGSTYMDTVEQMSKLRSTDGNYDTKKQNLTQQAMQEIENFRKEALFAVNTYVNHYGSDYDDKKFASVVALLNFNNPTGVIPTSAKDFQDSQSAYYRGREDAYQTMIDLGFKSVNDYSILGIAKRNSQTGEIYTKFNSPVAILNARESVWSSMAENVNAEIAAALEVAGIDRSEMFEGYYKAKAQGKAAAKQYKKDWNAKIVKAIAPTVYQYGADQVLENSTVQDYLDNYIFISNPYKTGDYLKEIFEVED